MNIPFEERAATKRKIIKCNWGDKNCLKKKKVAESFSISKFTWFPTAQFYSHPT